MDIKIDAQDMYNVLVTAGIEPNDAKAIIFDLLLAASGGGEPRTAPRTAPPQYAPAAPVAAPPRTRIAAPPVEEEEPLVEEPAPPQERAKVRKKIVSFSTFGGPAEPLR